MFELHPKLFEDCYFVGRFTLCQLLLHRDSRFPWLILVPEREGVEEIHHLEPGDRRQLLDESCLVAESLERLYQPDKLNVAVLGNIVPQLHMHHVARFQSDPVWPGPVWGVGQAQNYPVELVEARIGELRQALAGPLVL